MITLIREGFISHEDVQALVKQEVLSSGFTGEEIFANSRENPDWLKERVQTSVRNLMQLSPEVSIPERVRTWIYNKCLVITAGIPERTYVGVSNKPIELISIRRVD